MKTFFAWLDYKYLAIVAVVLVVFVYDSVQAHAPERLLRNIATSNDAEFVVGHLADGDSGVADAARENIAANPDAFTNALIGALAEGTTNLKVGALRVIADNGLEIDPGLIKPLLNSGVPSLDVQALRYFAGIGESIEKGVVEGVFISAADASEKSAVLESAPKILSPEDTGDLLLLAISEPDYEIKLDALARAIDSPAEVAADVLIEALYFEDTVAPLAQIALSKIGGKMFNKLIAALDDPRGIVKAGAAEVLGDIGNPRALMPLNDLFAYTNSEVRMAAGRAAGKLADQEQLIIYYEMIQISCPDSIIGVAAIHALGSAGYREAGGRLMQIAADPGFPDGLRSASIFALGEMGYPPAEQFLLERARDKMEENDIRRDSIEALGWVASDDSLALLREMLKEGTDFSLRISAARGLGRMTGRPDALQALMEAVDTERANLVLAEMVKAMADHGNPAAISAIEEAREKYVRDEVCDIALRKIELLSPGMEGS